MSLLNNLNNTVGRFQAENILVPSCVIGSLLVVVYSLPSPVMDFLLSINIGLGVIILLTTFFVSKPLEFSIFPSILLATTLFRLVLNIATTRLILTQGAQEGELAAGQVIKSFSQFVTGDSLVVGMVIFAIFIVIQFVVITKGATRISEVAARFTLDAMPGRQMAIDADLNARTITEDEARIRREELVEQGDFFGAMDGASRFVRGDAIAGVIITLINIFVGLYVGVFQHSMPIENALSVYTKLTIGDGLVTQVPALLISLATGILVTRSSRAKNLPKLILCQMFLRPVVLVLAGCFLLLLVATGMPPLPLLTVGSTCFAVALLVHRKKEADRINHLLTEEVETTDKTGVNERIEHYLLIDPMELEIGVGLLPLADPSCQGELLDKIRQIRREIAAHLGIVLPKVRVSDGLTLDENQYRIKIGGEVVALGTVYPNMLFALDTGLLMGTVPGLRSTDPASGAPALWIQIDKKEDAKNAGYLLKKPVEVLESHLTEVARQEAATLLTREATSHLINELKTSAPKVVEEIVPQLLKLSEVQQVLQRLLRERVSIRPLEAILEALGDFAGHTKNIIQLTEHVRVRLARMICARHRDSDGILHALVLSPQTEETIEAGIQRSENGQIVHLAPAFIEKLMSVLERHLKKTTGYEHTPVLLTSPAIRSVVRQITEKKFRSLAVLSHREIDDSTQVVAEGKITLE